MYLFIYVYKYMYLQVPFLLYINVFNPCTKVLSLFL